MNAGPKSLALLVCALFAAAVGPLSSWLLGTVGAVTLGIICVVALGAIGQVLQGIAEVRQDRGLKAASYYCSAAAFIVTASVALANGLPELLG